MVLKIIILYIIS